MKAHNLMIVLTIVVLTSLIGGCLKRISQSSTSRSIDHQSKLAPSKYPLITNGWLEFYRKLAPEMSYWRLNDILKDPKTIWYDKWTIIPAYQDTVGDFANELWGARYNHKGKGPISLANAERAFTPDGQRFSYPFGITAGLDQSANHVRVVNFISLPRVGDQLLPIAYWIVNKRLDPHNYLRKWHWVFPNGTFLGEIIFNKISEQEIYPVEVRTRQRFSKGWAVNVYRPFPTSGSLYEAIAKLRPNWQNQNSLRTIMDHLKNEKSLSFIKRGSPDFPGTFSQDGYLDVLPAFNDPALVKELLNRTFYSVYETVWKADGAKHTYAPTTQEGFSVVPFKNEVGLIQVNEQSCSRCHRDAGRPIFHFYKRASLYGDIWGEDEIFSFHPFEQSKIRGTFSGDNREVRKEFKAWGLVKSFQKIPEHLKQHYTKNPPAYKLGWEEYR